MRVPPDLPAGIDVRVAILDNGFDVDDPDLAGAWVLDGGRIVGIDLLDGDDDVSIAPIEPQLARNHGTSCASLLSAPHGDGRGIGGLCPSCRLLPIRGRDFARETTTIPRLASAIDWALAHRARILSISDGVPLSRIEPLQLVGLRTALARAEQGGLLVVASAGNDGATGGVRFPASEPTVLAVAASSGHGRVAGFSSAGTEVDVSAPGVCVLASDGEAGLVQFQGTSASAPLVAALAGNLLSKYPAMTPQEVRERIIATARRTEFVNARDGMGAGIVDFHAALAAP